MRLRSQATKVAAVAVVAATVLAACGSSSSTSSTGGGTAAATLKGAYGSLPVQTGTPKPGGVVNFAESPGAGPNYIFPITPAANSSVYVAYQFQDLMFRPLYWAPVGVVPRINYPLSLATKPVFSNGNKTVTIHMLHTYTWSDGAPVDAQDVVFYIDLVKAAVKENPANYGNYTPGYFPDNVTSAVATSKYTVTLTLDKSYNPQWFYDNQIGLISPLPSTAWDVTKVGGPPVSYTTPAGAKSIYDFLAAQSGKVATYATNPLWQVVDGPFHLTSFNASTDANTLAANPKYTGVQKPYITQINEVAFTSNTAEFNQLRSGALTVGYVPFSDLPQTAALQRSGYHVFGYPDFGFNYITYNFKDTTGHWNSIINQLYIRQAIAHLQNEPGVIRGIFHGAAGQAYGPVPAIPASPYAPANAATNPYPYSLRAAGELLASHGWKVAPGGTTTCTSPGSGPTNCGAGIPAGTPLSWNLFYSNQPSVIGEQVTALASAAKDLGITITAVPKTFNFILTNYSVPSAPANNNKWAMEDFGGFTNSIYPTTNTIFNTTGSFNEGGYSNPVANMLIHNSVFGGNPSAVSKEAQFLTANQPGLFQPSPDLIFAWKNNLSGAPDSFETLTQYFLTPEYWYFTK